jgi:hypothetical protein
LQQVLDGTSYRPRERDSEEPRRAEGLVTRYEHIELNISTATCAELLEAIGEDLRFNPEMLNLQNELRARLQRRDLDPQCSKNTTSEGWLDA